MVIYNNSGAYVSNYHTTKIKYMMFVIQTLCKYLVAKIKFGRHVKLNFPCSYSQYLILETNINYK
jgi:hypothetical protein